jgi:glycosyltransferase involved in cell wall biosynthesis
VKPEREPAAAALEHSGNLLAQKTFKRICHLTSVHPWNDVRIFSKECRSLVEAGFEVHLVAPHGRADSLSGFEEKSGALVGLIAGAHVHLLDTGRLRARPARAVLLAARLTAYALALDADLYHIHDPELLPHAAWRLRGRRIVYDIHEDLALQVFSKPWIPAPAKPVAAAIIRILERPLARRMDAVVAATPEVLDRFRKGRREGEDAIVVENAPRRDWQPAAPRDPEKYPMRIVYVGALTVERGITDLVDAMAHRRLSAAEGLDLAGPVDPGYLAMLSQRAGFAKARYHGVLEPARVANLLSQARVGVAALHPLPNYVASRPTKISEYLAAGLNVVASDFPLWRRVYGAQPGMLFVTPKNVAALASALTEALNTPPSGIALTLPCWEAEAKKLVKLYERLTERSC